VTVRGRFVALSMLMSALATIGAAAQTTFRAGVDLVRVDVSVTHGGQPVRGLTASDFSIHDSGVAQRVNSVTLLDDLAVSVSIVLDTSGSVDGERLRHLIDAGQGLLASLRPDDRAALITFSDRVDVQVPLTTERVAISTRLSRMTGRGATALHDAVWTALELAPQDETRPLVLVFTDGVDNASWIPRSGLVELARRTGVVIHAVELLDQQVVTARGTRVQAPPSALDLAAEVSGGRAWSAVSSKDLRELFTRAIAEMRARYLVTYYPQGVSKPGWHPLKIGTKGRGDITARAGYVVPPRE